MNKKYLAFGIMGFFAIALVTAGVVNFYSQKQVDMDIESPVVLHGDLFESISLIAGDGYNLYLIEGENLLDREIDVNVKFSLLKDGEELTNTEGFNLGYSSDIDYAYSEEYGNVGSWEEAQVWMNDNLNWFDWYLTGNLEDYDSSVITNHGGNSAFSNVLDFNAEIPESLKPGKFYAVVYFDVNEAVVPGDYTLSVDLIPTA